MQPAEDEKFYPSQVKAIAEAVLEESLDGEGIDGKLVEVGTGMMGLEGGENVGSGKGWGSLFELDFIPPSGQNSPTTKRACLAFASHCALHNKPS